MAAEPSPAAPQHRRPETPQELSPVRLILLAGHLVRRESRMCHREPGQDRWILDGRRVIRTWRALNVPADLVSFPIFGGRAGPMRTVWFLALCIPILPDASAQSTCGNVQLQLLPDYSFAVGSSTGGSAYAFTLGGQTLASGPLSQLALFHYDNSPSSTNAAAPSTASGVAYDNGRFGKGVYLQTGGGIIYPGALFNVSEGTVEMWIAPRFNGNDTAFSTPGHTIFRYNAANGDSFVIAEDSAHQGRILHTGATVNGQWESAYGSQGDMTGWKAGDWHHIAATFSASASHIRFYLDGVKIADNNEGHYYAPSAVRGSIQFGSTDFTLDELRISNVALSDTVLASDAARPTPFADNETLLSLAAVSNGQLRYSVAGCGVAAYSYTGIPIRNLSPPGGLLPAGSGAVMLGFDTSKATTCRYSLGSALDYGSMQALDTGPATVNHKAVASGLSTDPRVLNRVYVRCASSPGYVQSATYRVVAAPSGPFPRIGNIWLGGYVTDNAPSIARKTQLFLGANMSASEASALRTANPNVLIIPSIQLDDTWDYTLPETYYLHDINGKRYSDWCSIPTPYVLNMTRPEVAAYIGRQAYQALAQSNWAFDGMFFDSFSTTKQVNTVDCHGNALQIDADGDGKPDDQAQLNAAWAAGQYLAVNTLHSLSPGAYVSGHVLESPAQSESLAAFNGTSIEFFQQNVREGQTSFGTLWDLYSSWQAQAVPPPITLMQSAPPNQIAYGYGYYPLSAMSKSLGAFAQTYYPNMRFGLALALMHDGFFAHDVGDMAPDSPTAWWYDEYDFNLGYPLGPPVKIGTGQSANILSNAGFEESLTGWRLIVNNDGQAKATVAADAAVAADGNSSARISIASAGTTNWHIDLEQSGLPLAAGVTYQVQFWARANSPRTITVFAQGGAPNFPNYGLSSQIAIGTSWSQYSASFQATATASDGRLEFWVGDVAGEVWIDEVTLSQTPPLMYRRDFTSGAVLLNASATSQTVAVGPDLRRFSGTQAPKYQYIVDDSDAGFSATGAWNMATYESGLWKENGPYYHAWKNKARQLDADSGSAQWNLGIAEDDQYTLQAWLPAAPTAGNWTKNAIYEVISSGAVIFSTTLDQTTAVAGDAWHTIATGLRLTAAGAPSIRVRNGGTGSLIADAVYVTSAALYNDGSPAPRVTLAPYDGILLQRQEPVSASTARVNSVVNAASFQPAIASNAFVSITGTGFGNSLRSWNSSDFSDRNLPVSLDGVSVMINGRPALVEYVSPSQVNVIAPDDSAIGPVQVQVTTPQGVSYAATVLKQKLSPAFFTYQSGTAGYVAAIHLDGTLVGPGGPSSRPAVPGEVVEIFGTGFGPTDPATAASQLVSQPAPLSLPATVTIGGVNAPVQWAGIVSSGLYQLNVAIPNVPAGDLAVRANVSGFQSVANTVIAVAQQ